MAKHTSQTGSALPIIAGLIVLVILGVLGYVVWNNFMKDKPAPTSDSSQVSETQKKVCEGKGDLEAKDGKFCSESIGIAFKVPSVFSGKLKVKESYDLFKSGVDPSTAEPAGKSIVVYEGAIEGNDNYWLSIYHEPLRSGYSGVAHQLRDAYYDAETGILSNVISPTYTYDPQTKVRTTSGEYALGEPVPSLKIAGKTFYRGIIADAGVGIVTYFGVVKDKIVIIKLTSQAYMGDPTNDPSTLDMQGIFDEFDANVKALAIL